MAQGWDINYTAATITFYEAPANGAAIVVSRHAATGYNETDLWAFSAWNPGYGYPAEVEFYSDRLIFANTPAQPQTLWMSKAGDYNNHGRTTPTLDSDAITMTINARQVNAIRELIPMETLIIMTASAEVKLTTGADEVVAPGKVGFSFQSYYGSSPLASQVVGETALFIQGRGFVLRDLGFQFTKDGYTGNDLTVYAAHLLEGFTVIDMAYQQVPYSAVWIVRSDGALISVTYLREQEVVGWALHTTDGEFKTVCTIPEGDANAVYVGVRRTIGGVSRAYMERLAPRVISPVTEAFHVDSGLTYDGRNMPGTITLTGGTAWTEDEELTVTSSTAVWTGASDIGDKIRLDLGLETITVTITSYVSATVVKGLSTGTVPAGLRAVAVAQWDLLRDTLSGLEHLEGRTVAILGDGSVLPQRVVTGGSIALEVPCAIATVGLPYRSDIESLDLNAPGQETIRNRPKLIPRVTLQVQDSRGLKAGPDLDRLDEIKTDVDDFEAVIPLFTGLYEFTTSTDWNKSARMVVVQDDPLPACVLSLIPEIAVGGT